MEWYWWVLIIAAVAALVPLKIKMSRAFLKNQKEKQEAKAKLLEDDE